MLQGKGLGTGVLAALAWLSCGSVAASASSAWGPPPANTNPRPAPLAPQGVTVNQGPVTFEESEFTLGEVIPVYPPSTKVLTSLNGVPIPEIALACVAVAPPFAGGGGGGGDDCTVNGGPGGQLFVSPPGIEGPTDLRQVTVGFHTPTTAFRFGFTASCKGVPQAPVDVVIADGEGLYIETVELFLVDTGGFPEGQLAYEAPGGQTIGAIIVNAGAIADEGCTRFFFDNLAWQTDAVASVLTVPALSPAGALGLVGALALAGFAILRRRRASTR